MSQNKKQRRKAKAKKAKKHAQLMMQHKAHARAIKQAKFNAEVDAYIKKMLAEKLATIDENGMIIPTPQNEDKVVEDEIVEAEILNEEEEK